MRLERRRRHTVAAWLLAALFAAQGLSQWLALQHAVAHGAVHDAAEAAVAAAGDERWGHAAGDAACRIVDALLTLGSTADAAPVLHQAVAAAPPRLAAAPAPARREPRPFEARAPPA